jgi:hypothetical protein
VKSKEALRRLFFMNLTGSVVPAEAGTRRRSPLNRTMLHLRGKKVLYALFMRFFNHFWLKKRMNKAHTNSVAHFQTPRYVSKFASLD